MDLMLKGKSVLVTGASQGIGAAIAEIFAQEGCNLHLVARSQGKLGQLRERLSRSYHVEVDCHAIDLSRQTGTDKVGPLAVATDILVNNAGSIPPGSLSTLNTDDWKRGWDLKVFGYIELTRIFYEAMRVRGHGVIVNNIGSAGERYNPDYVAGSTGNSALMAFTRTVGGRSLYDGIRVLGVNPGPVLSERFARLNDRNSADGRGSGEVNPDLLKKFPMNRIATIEEVAALVAFLASPRAGYISGTIVTIDGGQAARFQ